MLEPFRNLPDLEKQLEELLAQVPRGRVTTYGALADALGNRIAARWVGHFMLHHEHGRECPCHRVVRAGGQIGEYIDGGPGRKAKRLAADGIPVRRGSVELDRFVFDRFQSNRPLETLRRVQEEMVSRVTLRSRRRVPRLVGGVDVSYPMPGQGVAGYALVEVESGELVWSGTVSRRVTFPYITSYLAFRELPILVDLVDEVRRAGRLADVVLVDGSGILHQRHAGIASHLGVAASTPTIGVTKKLLCGEVDLDGLRPHESRPVVLDDRVIGAALRATAGSRRPIFVSPGHRTNLVFAEQVVRRLLHGRRLPEPLYWADRLSRQAGQAEGDELRKGR
ncbi:MAG: endonuclease V [Planctomycetes bacterium]|nr:endonuclease V [Planctomycetota bacterium]